MRALRYAEIKRRDIANGSGVRVSLFVQGCFKHCKGCFNESTWDFNGGKPFTRQVADQLIEDLKPDYVKGLSILGGEPFEYVDALICLICEVKQKAPDKDIYVWSGYTWEEILEDPEKSRLLEYIDILVDGSFDESKKDISLQFRGSSNQRCIDVQDSLCLGHIVEWRWENDSRYSRY